MFYRQAASGQVPGVRLAAADAQCAEYLAEKIAQVESGQPMSGTLAETELNLRLYHGPARFELIVKDYQGEHVTLGSTEPIHEFFADCDAVFFCLDPEGSTDSVERRRRQQEIESLLERYIDRSEVLSTDRPVALLLTKFDRVLSGLGNDRDESNDEPIAADQDPGLEQRQSLSGPFVERLVDQRYGMTRHALRQHTPDSAIFAVSSFGLGSTGNRPPSSLRPMGLEGPLGWLAEQLEARDRHRWNGCGSWHPETIPGSSAAWRPTNTGIPARTGLTSSGRGSRRWDESVSGGVPSMLLMAAALLLAALAGYDFWGFHRALIFESDPENTATLVARHWSGLPDEHPLLPLFWPSLARQARLKRNEWAVKAAGAQITNGISLPDLAARLEGIKEQAPQLAPAIREVKQASERAARRALEGSLRRGPVALGGR